MPKPTQDESEQMVWLEEKGWQRARTLSKWCWIQPGTSAMFQFGDALDNQHALDREASRIKENGKASRSRKSVKGQ